MKLSELKKHPPVCGIPHMIHGGDYNPDQWLDMPEILSEDVRLMNLSGVNNASVAIFAWKTLEPEEGVYNFEWLDDVLDRLHAGGISVLLATPAGARPDWMDRDHPEVMRVGANRVRNLHGIRHNHCFTSPYYRKKVYEMNKKLAERYGNHPAVKMWHVNNEYGGECHCDYCQKAFRDWLREKYHNDINELNHEWWTAFWSHTYTSFDEIESPAPHGETTISGLTLDWKRFTTHQTIEFYKNEIAPIKEICPDKPCVVNLMEMYGGIDPWKFAPVLDVITWDSYPRWHTDLCTTWEKAAYTAFIHDYHRSLKKKPFMLMESTPSLVNWHDVNKLKRPGMHALSSLQAVAHGSDSVQYFQWRKSRGAHEKFHGAVVDHCGHEHTRVFREVQDLGDKLKKLAPVCGTCVEPDVAIICDWENRWAIEGMQGLKRDRKYTETCVKHYESFWKKGVPCDIIDMDQDFSSYRLIVAPMLYMLKPGTADRLKEFVRNGGQLVLTYLTGYVNQNDLCFLGGFPGDGLMEMAGVWAEEIDTLYDSQHNTLVTASESFEISDHCELIHPKEGCEVLAAYGSDFYAGEPALTRNPYGDGVCWYIAARTGSDHLDSFYGELIDEMGLAPAWLGEVPAEVSVVPRGGDGETYLFVMNFSEEEKTVSLNGSYTDMFTGEAAEGSFTLPVYGVRVLKMEG